MEISAGDILLKDIYNQAGVLIMQKGTQLTEDSLFKMIQHGIDYVDIEESQPDTVFGQQQTGEYRPPSFTIVDPIYQEVKQTLNQAISGFEEIFMNALTTGNIEDSKVDELLEPIVNQLVSHKDVVSLLLLLDNNDNYTYNHSMQVGMLSYYIATWLGYSQEEAYKAGKAGYLIDIGKCKISGQILQKPGKLTEEEFEQVKQHTVIGHDIILNSTGDELSALVALQHHEREDGSGYPHGLKGETIHPFAKIAAVADVYTAMTSTRVYQSKQEFLAVLRELNALSFGKLSPKPTQTLINHLLPNFIGKRVVLTSGETGSIVMTNQLDFFRPLVQTDSRFIDLSKERNIAIQEVLL